jgi:hypothetical protein
MLAVTVALVVSKAHASAEVDPIRAFVQQTLGTLTYRRTDADLNGDGREENLIYITDPKYCGSGGCTLVVLTPVKSGYRVVMHSTVTQLPIRLLTSSSHGWRDIGVTVQGGGIIHPYEARLRFNGRRYPSNPTVPPAIPLRRLSGRILIAS